MVRTFLVYVLEIIINSLLKDGVQRTNGDLGSFESTARVSKLLNNFPRLQDQPQGSAGTHKCHKLEQQSQRLDCFVLSQGKFENLAQGSILALARLVRLCLSAWRRFGQ